MRSCGAGAAARKAVAEDRYPLSSRLAPLLSALAKPRPGSVSKPYTIPRGSYQSSKRYIHKPVAPTMMLASKIPIIARRKVCLSCPLLRRAGILRNPDLIGCDGRGCRFTLKDAFELGGLALSKLGERSAIDEPCALLCPRSFATVISRECVKPLYFFPTDHISAVTEETRAKLLK
jgi:hypothetical protein